MAERGGNLKSNITKMILWNYVPDRSLYFVCLLVSDGYLALWRGVVGTLVSESVVALQQGQNQESAEG